jgi:hypothetical protein
MDDEEKRKLGRRVSIAVATVGPVVALGVIRQFDGDARFIALAVILGLALVGVMVSSLSQTSRDARRRRQ